MLSSVYMINAKTGYACGQDDAGLAYMLKTTNGGQTWIRQALPVTDGMLEDIFFVDGHGWAVGADYASSTTLIIYSEDGTSWSNAAHPTCEGTLHAVHFSDVDNGWTVGMNDNDEHPIAYRTTNAGASWKSVTQPLTEGTFFDVVCIDENTAVAGGGNGTKGFIILTTDGGVTWSSNLMPTVSLSKSSGLMTESTQNVTGLIAALAIVGSRIYAVANQGHESHLLSSPPFSHLGGAWNWHTQYSEMSTWIWSLFGIGD